MNLKSLALLVVIMIFATIAITFATDLLFVTLYYDDVRTHTYIGGFHVAGMAADPTALAQGSSYTGELYKDEDIMAAFKEFSDASFLGMSKKNTPDMEGSGTKRHYRYPIGKMSIKEIVTSCEITSLAGVKGVIMTVEYRVDPKLNMLYGDGFMPKFPYYRVVISRKFRLMGQ